MIIFVTESKIHAFILEKIFLEIFFLCSYPGKWKSGCNVYLCTIHSFPIKFSCNSRQCQHIIVLVLRFLCTELLVFLSDLVIHAIVNKKIILEDWLLVISGYTGWKASGGSFHVSITMINPDHHNYFIIVVFHHSHNHTSHFLNSFFTFSQIREKPIFVSAKTLIHEKGQSV